MATSIIRKTPEIHTLLAEINGINSSNYMVTNFAAGYSINPSAIFAAMVRSDSGFSQAPISVFYNNLTDSLYVRTTASPTSGTVSICIAYTV